MGKRVDQQIAEGRKMTQIFSMPLDERRLRFASVEPKTGMASIIIEKDYWVVWALEQVFNVAELKDHLTFKGGTSLSKVYGLIKRFSEDIDLSIEKSFFGFADDKIGRASCRERV